MIYVHMLCFNTYEMIAGGMQNFKDTVALSPEIKKVAYELGFPGLDKRQLEGLCNLYGWEYREIPNISVADNWAQVMKDLKCKDWDFIIGFDPDCRLNKEGWLAQMVTILANYPQYPFVMPARTYHDEAWCVQQHGAERTQMLGINVTTYRQLIAWSMGGYRCDWLNFLLKIHGTFKQENAVYGYGEHWQYAQMLMYGKNFLALSDFYDDHQHADARYTEWKKQSADRTTHLKYEEWVKQ